MGFHTTSSKQLNVSNNTLSSMYVNPFLHDSITEEDGGSEFYGSIKNSVGTTQNKYKKTNLLTSTTINTSVAHADRSSLMMRH